MGKPGKRMRRRLLKEELTALRSRWRQLALATAGWAAATFLIGWSFSRIFHAALLGAFIAGALTASWLFVIREMATLRANTFYRRMGPEAEGWTLAELRKLGKDWTVFNNLERCSVGDIDHIVFGPQQILAVETKWYGRALGRKKNPGRLAVPYRDLQQVREAAKALTSILSEQQVMGITPVLMVWGPGVTHVPNGWFTERDVKVLVGAQAKQWRPLVRQAGWSAHCHTRAQEAVAALLRGQARTA